MIGDNGEKDEADFDDNEDESLDEDAMPDIGGETIIDIAAVLEDDDLVGAASKPDPDEVARKREVRRRLEEIAERRNQKLDDTFNFNLDDEI